MAGFFRDGEMITPGAQTLEQANEVPYVLAETTLVFREQPSHWFGFLGARYAALIPIDERDCLIHNDIL